MDRRDARGIKLFTPGPVNPPPYVIDALAAPVLHHRSPGFRALYEDLAGKMKALMEERLGHTVDGPAMFKLNPKVDDIPDRYSLTRDGLKLITMGHVEEGGKGCMCLESSFLKNILDHILLNEGQWVIMDMEAGVEHLGRATAKFVDALIVAVEPTPKAVKTAERVRSLAADIKLDRLGVVVTKVRDPEDVDYVRSILGDIPILGHIPYSAEILDAERKGNAKITLENAPTERLREILDGVQALKA